MIAGLTPSDWDIQLLDENFEKFQYTEADLVGITALTSASYRAYEIASLYRKNNIPVVLGGIHISMMPDEAEGYANSIVIGEAESVWNTLLNDFDKGTLKKRYYGELSSLTDRIFPRRDLFHSNYTYANIQTTRGCPLSCDFCSVHNFNGSKYRERPVKDVLDEMETIENERLFIIDDNLIGYTKKSTDRAIDLFKGMISRGIKKDWYCQASLNIADNEEVLEYAAKSGCRMILIGIESEKVDQLHETNKKINLRIGVNHYEEAFQRIHKHGISVLGALVFGLDSDSIEDIKNRTRFAIDSGIDAMQATIVTPLPGTALFKRLESENRLLYTNFPRDWERYHFHEVSHQPIKMTSDELSAAMDECWRTLWDEKTVYRKMLKTLKQTKNAKAATWAFTSNTERHNLAFGREKPALDIEKMLGNIKLSNYE